MHPPANVHCLGQVHDDDPRFTRAQDLFYLGRGRFVGQ